MFARKFVAATNRKAGTERSIRHRVTNGRFGTGPIDDFVRSDGGRNAYGG
ncbi:hypothetical protein Natoc_1428 [Natronococcus occultus SP4]|uniref:Uncharacterized protein n=1 Tax=Natronococcus occultus SP4 TaxID=694430 RepID=L0JYQ5_9EURY|nr:hypothetical protein Natoc_1428 [Natronococcus occultus SP4]